MMRKHRPVQGGPDPRIAFYAVSGAGILMFLILSWVYGNRAYVWMVQENKPGIRFWDYFFHVAATVDRRNLYTGITWDAAGCFPPLAYCMYYALFRLTAPHGVAVNGKEAAEAVPGALSVFTYYLIFCAAALLLVISMTGKKSRKKDALIFTLLMISAVFSGSLFLTGNSTALVLVMVMAALQMREDQNPVKRETALILLAASVGFKLYPAVFGLLYLKEKRYRELGRLIQYSALLLFLPFIFFGGFTGMKTWIKNILSTMGYGDFGRLQYLKGVLVTLSRMITGEDHIRVCGILTLLICLGWAWMAWKSKSRERTCFFLICIMVLFPSNAYRYTLSYFAIPLVAALKEERPAAGGFSSSWLIMAFYGALFTIPAWWTPVTGLYARLDFGETTSAEFCLYMTLYALITTVMMMEFISWLRRRKGVSGYEEVAVR